MQLRILFLRISILLAVFVFFSCSKAENADANQYGKEIFGKWNLVFSSGGRVLPIEYLKGERVWIFDDTQVQKLNEQTNDIELVPYTIKDTIGESQLILNGHYFGNITLISEDSLVINSEIHIGCGGGKVFIR